MREMWPSSRNSNYFSVWFVIMLCTNLAFVVLMEKWVKREGGWSTVCTFKTLHAFSDVNSSLCRCNQSDHSWTASWGLFISCYNLSLYAHSLHKWKCRQSSSHRQLLTPPGCCGGGVTSGAMHVWGLRGLMRGCQSGLLQNYIRFNFVLYLDRQCKMVLFCHQN